MSTKKLTPMQAFQRELSDLDKDQQEELLLCIAACIHFGGFFSMNIPDRHRNEEEAHEED